MSDTPRSDAFSKVPSDPQETWAIARDWAGFARTLERELDEAETRISELVIEKAAAAEPRVVLCPPDVLAAARKFADEYRKEFYSAQGERESWDGFDRGFDAREPLDAAYLALVDAIGAAQAGITLNVKSPHDTEMTETRHEAFVAYWKEDGERAAGNFLNDPARMGRHAFYAAWDAAREFFRPPVEQPKMQFPWRCTAKPCGLGFMAPAWDGGPGTVCPDCGCPAYRLDSAPEVDLRERIATVPLCRHCGQPRSFHKQDGPADNVWCPKFGASGAVELWRDLGGFEPDVPSNERSP